MSEIVTPQTQASRDLYSKVNVIVFAQQEANIRDCNKIYNLIYLIQNELNASDSIISPVLELSKRMRINIESSKNIFQTYLSTKNVNFNITLTTGLPSIFPPIIENDVQNRYIYNSLILNLSNNLTSYIETDQELFLQNNKSSLDGLFTTLTADLMNYRKYFNANIMSSYSVFSKVQEIASETSQDRRSFFDTDFTPNQAIALNNVDINNPMSYNASENWKSLFSEVLNITTRTINTNVKSFFIKNVMFNSIQNILSDENSKFINKVTYSSDYSINVIPEPSDSTKLKITSPINLSNINSWLDHSVFYYNQQNAYSKSKIIETDSTNKTIKLSPYSNGLTSVDLSRIIKFPSYKEGFSIEKTFQQTTLNTNLFSMQVIETNPTGETITKDISFTLNSSDFNTNYFKLPNATVDPLKNGWTLNNTVKDGISFYRDGNNDFIFSKQNQINTSGSYVYTDFYVSGVEVSPELNLTFEYEIKDDNFVETDLSVELEYYKTYSEGSQYNTPLPLIKFKNLTKRTGNRQTYSVKFSPNQYRNYRLKIRSSSINTTSFIIKFNNFYVGDNTINNGNTITVNTPKKLLDLFYKTSAYKSNKDLTFSQKSETVVDLNGASTIQYKIKITSEPYHIGSTKKIKFYNVNPNLKWLFFNSNDLTQQTYIGLDPILITETGNESKYYDSFISLIKRIFSVLNAYALSRLLVPEAFDEETDQFNIGVNVTPSIKVLIQDLLDDLTPDLDFRSNLEKDPRSNFLQKGPQDTLNRKSAVWKSGGLKDAFGLKKFTEFKNTLQKIKTALKKVKSILDAIKAFVDILSQLIEIGEDILGALLTQVIKQVEGVVKNIASTGVYWLPIVRYYATNNKFHFINQDKATKYFLDSFGDDVNNLIKAPYPTDPSISINNSFLLELEELMAANKKMLDDDLSSDLNTLGLKDKKDRWSSTLPWLPFRSTTYEEFKNVIIEGLLDPDDLPELGLTANQTKNNETFLGQRLTGGVSASIKGDEVLGIPYVEFSASELVVKPGAPQWGKGSQSAVVIVAICLPAPEDIIMGWKGFLKTLLTILKPIATVINLVYTGINDVSISATKEQKFTTGKIERYKKYIKELKQQIQDVNKQISDLRNSKELDALEKINNLVSQRDKLSETKYEKEIEYDKEIKKIQEKTIDDYWDFSSILDINDLIKNIEKALQIEEDSQNKPPENREQAGKQAAQAITPENSDEISVEGIIKDIGAWWDEGGSILDNALEDRAGRFSGMMGNYPDFVGITLGSIAPGFFSIIKGFLNKLKKLNRKESTFSLSEKFELMIQPIRNRIKDLEEIIKSIDAIIDLIEAILNINISYLTIKSNNGIEDIIEQLENSTGFPNEDKRQIILGGLLGAGTIDPNGNEFNMQGYFEEASQEFDELASDLFDDLQKNNEQKGISFLNKFFG